MIILSRTPERALQKAIRSVLLGLPHRWLPRGAKKRAALRNPSLGDVLGGIEQETVNAMSSRIIADMGEVLLDALPADPMDAACTVAARCHLGRVPSTWKLVAHLRELEERARGAHIRDKAERGGRASTAASPKDEDRLLRIYTKEIVEADPKATETVLSRRLQRRSRCVKQLTLEAARKRISRFRNVRPTGS
jgi:hypothetical protein